MTANDEVEMRIAVFGLGHVGLITAAMLAEWGHTVVGVDCDARVRDLVQAGRAPFREYGLEPLVQRGLEQGRLHVTADAGQAVAQSQISLVCVGTPEDPGTGLPDLRAVERVLAEIGAALQETDAAHLVVIRSTVPPWKWAELEAHFRRASRQEVSLCAHPEFLREGQALDDFESPPFVILGHENPGAGELLGALYAGRGLPLLSTTPETAMLLKYACNAWHALKVAFANEIGAIAARAGSDGGEVMSLLVQDEHLNLSPAYLRPGGPYGGSCLPKDLAALRAFQVGTPLLEAIHWSNRAHLNTLVERALDTGATRYGVLGLSFKLGTSDLRESPAVQVVARLRAAGRDVRIYDPDVPPELAGEHAPYLVGWDALAAWEPETWVVCKEALGAGRRLSGEVVGWI